MSKRANHAPQLACLQTFNRVGHHTTQMRLLYPLTTITQVPPISPLKIEAQLPQAATNRYVPLKYPVAQHQGGSAEEL